MRAFADECVPTFQFLLDNGVTFIEKPIVTPDASTVPRVFVTHEWHIPSEVIAPRRNRNGSGLVRRLAESARKKGVQILLKHEMTEIVRDEAQGPRARHRRAGGQQARSHIEAQKGVVIATGGHTGNVNFRRMFDPRLTEEYQQAGLPYSFQGADGELAAMDIGASLWATGTQTTEVGPAITKTRHVGMPLGLSQPLLRDRQPDLPSLQGHRADGDGLARGHPRQPVRQAVLERARQLATTSSTRRWHTTATRTKLNGGGPIWAIFDADAVARQKWKPEPPHVDPDGYFFSADTIHELAGQDQESVPEAADLGRGAAGDGEPLQLVRRVRRIDADFDKPTPLHPIEKPPFYAAWATPILHDSLTGLRTDTHSAGDRHPRRGDPGPLLRGRIAGRLRPARADALPGVRPHRRPPRGAPPDRRDVGRALMTEESGGALVHLTVSEPLPLEVPAGDALAITARASCPDGRDRTGMAIAVTAPDGRTELHAFALHADGVSETATITLVAPPHLGVHVFRFTLSPARDRGHALCASRARRTRARERRRQPAWRFGMYPPLSSPTRALSSRPARNRRQAWRLAGRAIEVCTETGDIAGARRG